MPVPLRGKGDEVHRSVMASVTQCGVADADGGLQTHHHAVKVVLWALILGAPGFFAVGQFAVKKYNLTETNVFSYGKLSHREKSAHGF